MFEKILRVYKIWLFISLIIWNIYFFSIGNALPLYVDLLAISFYLGTYVWKKWDLGTLTAILPRTLFYFTVAYGMVLFEEVIAALINNLNEGFSISLFIIRIGQFWAFNVLAFSGIIIAMYICNKFRILGNRELLVLAALFGIFAEHVLVQGNFIVILVYAPITMFIYYMIYLPSISLLEHKEIRNTHWLFRYVVSIVLVFVLSTPFVAALSQLRKNSPEYFPPCSMIWCD